MIIDFHTHHPAAEGVISPRSFGIHPWHSQQWLTSHCSDPFGELERAMPDHMQVVGECGLDKCCQVSFSCQMEVFQMQLTMAERLRLPVVVHCVRSFNEIIQVRRLFSSTPWVVHGFTGSSQLAQQLAHFGIGVSFGAALTHPLRTKVHQALCSRMSADGGLLPLTFLETDDSPIAIGQVYGAAAQILEIDAPALDHAIKRNYSALIRP